MVRLVPFVLLVVGCGSSSDGAPVPASPTSSAPEPASPPAQTPAAAEAPASRIPRCGPAETSQLTSYLEVTAGDGVPRHLEVHRDPASGVWSPAEHIAMPLHHATAIRWTNLEDLPFLADAGTERLRFDFVLLTRDTRQVPGERQWRTEYTAAVASVCAISDDAFRAIGVHLPDVRPSTSGCDALEDAVEAAVRAAATCSADAECEVRFVPACQLRGLGCDWVAVRRGADVAPIEAAIRAHQTRCPVDDCDCMTPPTAARCVDGLCRAP